MELTLSTEGPDGKEPVEDPADFDRFFQRHYEAAVLYALRRGLQEADAHELASDAFHILWSKRASISSDPIPALYATCRNLLMHTRRSLARRQHAEDRAAQEQALQHSRATAKSRATDRIRDALQELTETAAEVIKLMYWDGLTAAQIATILDSSEQAVWAQASRARRQIARYLEGGSHD